VCPDGRLVAAVAGQGLFVVNGEAVANDEAEAVNEINGQALAHGARYQPIPQRGRVSTNSLMRSQTQPGWSTGR
jgi:uncharacterized FAD-dependent dehydrogenase